MLATTSVKHLITGLKEITDLNRRMGPPLQSTKYHKLDDLEIVINKKIQISFGTTFIVITFIGTTFIGETCKFVFKRSENQSRILEAPGSQITMLRPPTALWGYGVLSYLCFFYLLWFS
jgi:hypothetical protein